MIVMTMLRRKLCVLQCQWIAGTYIRTGEDWRSKPTVLQNPLILSDEMFQLPRRLRNHLVWLAWAP